MIRAFSACYIYLKIKKDTLAVLIVMFSCFADTLYEKKGYVENLAELPPLSADFDLVNGRSFPRH